MEIIKKLLKKIKSPVETADELYEKGKSEAIFGNYRDAIVFLSKAIAISPTHVNALLERGKAKAEMKEHKSALADYSLVIALQPKNATAYQRRAKSKDFLKDFAGAIKDLDSAVKLQPDFAIAFYERGLIKMMALKDRVGAELDLTKAGDLGFAAGHNALKEFYKPGEK